MKNIGRIGCRAGIGGYRIGKRMDLTGYRMAYKGMDGYGNY